jgi:hypothetical protein
LHSKYEREIDEILRRSNWAPRRTHGLSSKVRRWGGRLAFGSMVARAAGSISPTLLIGLSAGLALLAVALQGITPDARLPLVVASVVCFLLAFVVGAVARRAARSQNWRGTYLGDQPPSFDDWLRRIRGNGPRKER